MREFERAGFFDDAVDGPALETCAGLFALFVDFLADCGAAEVVDTRGAQLFEEGAAHIIVEQDPRAAFANVLKHHYYGFEVADMEGGEGELDVAEVTIAVLEALSAGFADAGFGGYTLWENRQYFSCLHEIQCSKYNHD